MFEGWKIWKRNGPLSVYDPRVFGTVFVGYVFFSTMSNFLYNNFNCLVNRLYRIKCMTNIQQTTEKK